MNETEQLLWLPDIRSTVLLSAFIFLLISWWMRQPWKVPPGPMRWPILGSLPNLGLSMYHTGLPLHQFMAQQAKKYGNVFGIYLGSQYVVFANSSQSVREAFQNVYLTDRPRIMKSMNETSDEYGVLMACGDAWKVQRRFTLSTFRTFGVGKRSFQDQISGKVDAVFEEFSKFEGKRFDPEKGISNATCNIICSVVFGKRFEYSDNTLYELIHLLEKLLQTSKSGYAVLVFPALRYLQFGSNDVETQTQKIQRQLHDFVGRIIESHKETFNPSDLRDYIDVYLNELDQARDNDFNSLVNIHATILALFAAGTETTTTTLRWALLYMIAYPEVQKKVQCEIDNAVGRNRLPDYADKDRLPFTESTLMEVQRLSTVVPLAVPHYASEDTALGGYYIPKNTIIMGNIWGVHHDPKLWNDPDCFRPDRFIKDGVLIDPPEHFIPFSVGRRVCLGEHLAKMELFIFFTRLLHRYSFTSPKDSPPISFEGRVGATNGPYNYEFEAISRATGDIYVPED